jgi:hypothetical protein
MCGIQIQTNKENLKISKSHQRNRQPTDIDLNKEKEHLKKKKKVRHGGIGLSF